MVHVTAVGIGPEDMRLENLYNGSLHNL